MLWTPVPGERSYGIAIHNYQKAGEHRLKLAVGECVHILEECENWYYGYAIKNRSFLGIYPKSIIHIMDPSIKDASYYTTQTGSESNIVSEVTSVLREWGMIWKRLYTTRSSYFKEIENRMHELIKLRTKVLSGTLPVDEMKEVKRLITCHIDIGNKRLGLDMVVRDEYGFILNPEDTSTIELFRQHELATQRILNASSDHGSQSYQTTPRSNNYTFFLSVHKLICKSVDNIELLFTLYDQRLSKPFSENFIVRWNRNMFLSDPDKFYNFRALFTDLGSRDLAREKVYLVCYVIRNDMDLEQNRKSSFKNNSIENLCSVRRPHAVACYNLHAHFDGNKETDEDRVFLPLLPCEKDTLEGTLKRYFSLKEPPMKDSKGQNVLISFKLCQADLQQVREEILHIMRGNIATIRKMGFPEVILPGDVRNDLYLTLAYGEFSKGTKSSDKNIEAVVTVCNEKGVSLQGGVILGGGIEPQTEYRSVVYYHDDKPRWYETFKVVVAIEEFKNCHLKFLFKHRSLKNETKEKNEKPFALSFVRLMQNNGTILRDEPYELLVYKIDQKKYESTDISYLELPSQKTEFSGEIKLSSSTFTLCNKDTFIIQPNVCSTKLTQNVDLLGFLNWSSEPHCITENLSALMKVEGEEVVKFLQDVLDTLFNILMLDYDQGGHDDMVFNCLLYVIGLVLDRKYLHFQPVLTSYIEKSFSATLAYNKLIIVLKQKIYNVLNMEKDEMLLIMKSLKYIMKFIIRSRYLYSRLNDERGNEFFESSFTELMKSIALMMRYENQTTLVVQATCLKHLPSSIPDILNVFDEVKLSKLLIELIHNLPCTRLPTQKMMTIDDIIYSPLFLKPSCRDILLSPILIIIKQLLEGSDEGSLSAEHRRNKSKSVAKIAKVLGANCNDIVTPDEDVSQLQLCIKILGDIMDLLFRPESGDSLKDISEIILTILRSVIQTTIRMDRENPWVGNLCAVMISIFRQMTDYHFDEYIQHFNTHSDLLDFLMEILLVFKDLISRPVYPKDWCDMILLQNYVILKTLRRFSVTIQDRFLEEFEYQLWNNFFHCAVAFLTQPALQLETFSQSKKWVVLARYRDMRRRAGIEIKNKWNILGRYKKHFVPHLVGPFLEMTLIPEEALRRDTIPIFFDMMQTEFYSTPNGFFDRGDRVTVKTNFIEFENEMIAKLDNMVEKGMGDEQYKNLFHDIMMSRCEYHSVPEMREQGIKFVNTATRLIERLLEYRRIINDDSKENRMICTKNLLDFYDEINRKEMYIRYVNKLCTLHLECENYPEAAYTLSLHSKLLMWSDTALPLLLKSPKYSHCETHRQLKEALYQDMIKNFNKGKMWECAILISKELMRHYEEESFEYIRLSGLHNDMSKFYERIVKESRPKPVYFRIAYYGRGFPSFLSNQVFIHREREYDTLIDFRDRMMNRHLNAHLMKKLDPPSHEIKESNGQYIQINHVEPIMDEKKQKLLNRSVNEQILKYYKANEVQKFQYSRPVYVESEGEEKNEFANLWVERTVLRIKSPLPGVLRWFPVVSTETFMITPLKNAIENMEATNKKLRENIVAHKNDPTLPLNPLTQSLSGIVDPQVMGGITNYEKAFFVPEYVEKHPEDVDLINTLKDLIASQIPLLDIGIQIHSQRVPVTLMGLQVHLEKQFFEMKVRVEEKYGKKVCDIKYENVKLRRRTDSYNYATDRLSHSSITSAEVRSMRSYISLPSPFSSTLSLNREGIRNKASSILSGMSPETGSGSTRSKSGGLGSLPRKKGKDKEKKKRRAQTESKITLSPDMVTTKSSNSLWYTDSENVSSNSTCSVTAGSPTLVKKTEVTQINSIKSDNEKEKISSRPSSDSSYNQSDQLSILSNVTRDSFDSTNSEDDRVPPPLPAKTRELDFIPISSDTNDSCDTLSPNTPYNSVLNALMNKLQSPIEVADITTTSVEDESPPTPPPKKTSSNRLSHTIA